MLKSKKWIRKNEWFERTVTVARRPSGTLATMMPIKKDDRVQPEVVEEETDDEEGDAEEHGHTGDDVDKVGDLPGDGGLAHLQSAGQVGDTAHHGPVTGANHNARAHTYEKRTKKHSTSANRTRDTPANSKDFLSGAKKPTFDDIRGKECQIFGFQRIRMGVLRAPRLRLRFSSQWRVVDLKGKTWERKKNCLYYYPVNQSIHQMSRPMPEINRTINQSIDRRLIGN